MLLAALGVPRLVAAGGAEPPAAEPPSSLQACASVAADSERLACYDRLAGRTLSSSTAPLPKAPAAAAVPRAAPSAAAPVAASSAAAPAAAAAAAPKESFGLYAEEHPNRALTASLDAPIVAVGKSASGRMTVALEGGALWELDEADPLLAVGDVVTITRAALGSYILHTPSQRSHRVRRLR
jgi:hypothetical protein